MNLIVTNVYLFVLAVVLALLEIQIEGAHGWAQNLPTWRPKNTKFWKLYRKFMGDKEPTGYHLTMFTFVLLILHLPYVFGLDLNIFNWLKTLSLFFMFIVLWDFLWFVLNPHYPLKHFSKEHIWWHKKWWGRLPIDYYFGIIVSWLVLLPIILDSHQATIFDWWLFNLLLFLGETLFIIAFASFVLKINNWNRQNKK
jgi:hypothetical protein